MNGDLYSVCSHCGHVETHPPHDNDYEQCENCRYHGCLRTYIELSDAEDRSEQVVEANDRAYTDQLEARRWGGWLVP